MAKAKRTAVEVCVAYSFAVEAVREHTRILRDNRCEEESKGELDTASGFSVGQVSSCLDEFFQAPKGPDGEFPRFQEFYDRMCDACKKRLQAINDRREARKILGAAKRAVEAIGKREAQ